ncbi:MAG: two-component system sensor histidine kinase CreC [Gammaproteobacteria bacterium]|nr:two-component system sensor histidine kinase CreC [Gammaproteobacteria bacterium]
MRLLGRILLGYLLVLGVGGWFVVSSTLDEIKPAMRQSAEETLVDSANLLARLVAEDLAHGSLDDSTFAARLREYANGTLEAEIFGVAKRLPNHRVYVTDARGRVVFDSSGRDVGADYSRWNDVYLTLRGRYGARSTNEGDDPETGSVMYVAAPVRDGAGGIIGVLTVGKPNQSMLPFLHRAERRAWLGAAVVLLAAVGAALAIAWWNTRSVHALTAYAQRVSAGERAALPRLREPELATLGRALEDMRSRLDGKTYIEHYVQALTHELKSPLASILGAAELLGEDLDAADRARLVGNIAGEARRIHELVERLLALAQLEQRGGLTTLEDCRLAELVETVVEARTARRQQTGVTIECAVDAAARVRGEPFLLRQAIGNLLDNALDFTPPGGVVRCTVERHGDDWTLCCHNPGPCVPDYALPRVTERFFSLPRPATGRKSSGLGLCFVAEIAALHGGAFSLANAAEGGVAARLRLPAA